MLMVCTFHFVQDKDVLYYFRYNLYRHGQGWGHLLQMCHIVISLDGKYVPPSAAP